MKVGQISSEITTNVPEESNELPRSVPTDALFLEMGIGLLGLRLNFDNLHI